MAKNKKIKPVKKRHYIIPNKKECVKCHFDKKVYRNTPEGPICWDCGRSEDALARAIGKTKKGRMFIKTSPILDADSKLSIYIRRLYLVDGFIKCYTCDQLMEFREAQCGHFISRDNKSTRWLIENVRPQCHNCNVHLHGNLKEYEKRLEAECTGLPDKLRVIGREIFKPTIAEVRAISDDLHERLGELIKFDRNLSFEILRRKPEGEVNI